MRSKKFNLFFSGFLITLLLLSSVSSIQYTFQANPKDGSGNPVPSTTYSYAFNWTTSSDCSGVVFTNSSTIVTDITGSANITVTLPNTIALSSIPAYICEYRNGSLRATHTMSSIIVENIYGVNSNFSGDIQALKSIYSQGKNLSIGYDYALNGSTGGAQWNANFSNFTTLYGNDVSNASTRGYSLNASLWSLNYSDYLAIRGYSLNDSLWTLNYSTYLTKPTWAQVVNGTAISMTTGAYALNDSLWTLNYSAYLTKPTWSQVVNGTMLSYAQALNNTLMQQTNWNATNTSYYLQTNPFGFYNSSSLQNLSQLTDNLGNRGYTHLTNFTDNLGNRGYTHLTNFTDDLGNRGYTSLSNFTDNLGKRGYTHLSNFTNDGIFINWGSAVNGTLLSYAQALNNTLMQQANWNATNTSYFDLNKANTA